MTPRHKRANRGLAFNAILWPLGIGAALIVAFWPIMMEVYAGFAWQKIPCHVSPPDAKGAQQFFFHYEGKDYYCSRLNMWPAKSADAHDTAVPNPAELNGICYVNGSSPPVAVLYLNAWQHLDQGVGQFIGAGLILVVTTFIAVSGSRARKRAIASPESPETESNDLPPA